MVTNGIEQPNVDADPLKGLVHTRDILQAKIDIREKTEALNFLEHEDQLQEELGKLIDPREFLDAGSFGHHGINLQLPVGAGARISDREGGQNFPFFRNEIELSWIRGFARILTGATETPISILENLKNYTIAQGFDYSAKPDADAREAPPEGLVEEVNRIVKDFLEDNKWNGKKDREFFERSRRDGEVFLGLWHTGKGRVETRFIEPEQISEPGQTRALEDWIEEFAPQTVANPSCWRFGIHTPEDDVEKVFGFHVQWDQTNWDYLPVSRIEHMKLNVDGNIKRGMSDFFPTGEHLQSIDKLVTNLLVGSATSAGIAWIRQYAKGATKQTINNQVGSETMVRHTVDYPDATRTENHAVHKPGTVLNVTSGMEYLPGPMGSQRNPAFVTALGAGLRSVGTRWSMPEFLISGDASNSNFASALVAEGPFVKSIEAKQHDYILAFTSILWKVIRIAFEAGRLDEFNLDFSLIRRMIELEIEPPRVATRDKKAETERSAILKANGILSPKTWASQENLDFEQEQENGAKPDAVLPPIPGAPSPSVSQPTSPGAGATEPSATPTPGVEPEAKLLSGIQITSANEIANLVNNGGITREIGISRLEIALGMTREQAAEFIGLPGQIKPQPVKREAITEAVAKVLESVETPEEVQAVIQEAMYP